MFDVFTTVSVSVHLSAPKPCFPTLMHIRLVGGRPSSKTMIWMKTCFETHRVFLLLVRPIEMTGRALLIKHPRDAQSIKNRNSVSRCDYLVEESVQTFLLKILERLSNVFRSSLESFLLLLWFHGSVAVDQSAQVAPTPFWKRTNCSRNHLIYNLD